MLLVAQPWESRCHFHHVLLVARGQPGFSVGGELTRAWLLGGVDPRQMSYQLRSTESREQAGQWERVRPPSAFGGLGSRGSGHRGRRHHGSCPPRAATERPPWLPSSQKHNGRGPPATTSPAPVAPAPPSGPLCDQRPHPTPSAASAAAVAGAESEGGTSPSLGP